MNRLILSFLFATAVLTASSQKVYFIYVQTETEQPFFLKMDEKVYSSTASGYLILPKLRDSVYNFSIGFPQNKWGEQHFTVPLRTKDHGYILKDFGDKGWGLYDLQSLSIQMSSTNNARTARTDSKDVSVFTDILSKAADDPSLKEKPIQVKMEEKQAPVAINPVKKEDIQVVKEPDTKKDVVIAKIDPIDKKQDPKTDIAVIKKEEVKTNPPVVKKEEVKIDPPIVKKEEVKTEIPVVKKEEAQPVTEEVYKRSLVVKKSESSNTDGFGLAFIDTYADGKKDTVRLVIPNPKPVVNTTVNEVPKNEKKFLDISSDTAEKITPVVKKEESKTAIEKPIATKVSPMKSACAEPAAEPDFFKLRKKMAAVNSDDEMVAEANKYFKSKCFSVAQLKNLSSLFLNDAGKYKFFDAAYNYTTDKENFPSLQGELRDEYYINRFKAMLRN